MFQKKLEDMLNDGMDKVIIDLRDRENYEKETFPGAVNIYYEELKTRMGELPKNKRIYVFCYRGNTGAAIAEELSEKGYDIYSIEGGYQAILRWKVHRMMQNIQDGNELRTKQTLENRNVFRTKQNIENGNKFQTRQNVQKTHRMQNNTRYFR